MRSSLKKSKNERNIQRGVKDLLSIVAAIVIIIAYTPDPNMIITIIDYIIN